MKAVTVAPGTAGSVRLEDVPEPAATLGCGWPAMQTISPGGMVCLAGVGSAAAPGTGSAAALATGVVLKNVALSGSVHASRRRY
jgi:hypothetical protein